MSVCIYMSTPKYENDFVVHPNQYIQVLHSDPISDHEIYAEGRSFGPAGNEYYKNCSVNYMPFSNEYLVGCLVDRFYNLV